MSKAFTIESMRGHSDGFYRYIKKIGEATSRQEEDELVTRDLQKLKATYSGNNEDPERAKENVMRVVYAEMLGHPAEFGYIHCVNLSASTRLSFKRTGYLATWLCIPPGHELMYLTVANLQKDLRSPNFLEVAAALDGAARFLRPELIVALVPDVTALLSHNKISVRRKAVEALHAFYNRTDSEVADVPAFRQALCDRDPSVMGAAVRLLYDVIRRHPRSQHDLLDSFVSILTQVTERRLPRSYDYHHTPAPWLQITLLRLIALLVGQDQSLALKVEQTLHETMMRADNGMLVGVAVICEVVRTVSTLPHLPSLVALCGEAVAHFLTSRSANLRLAGIHALTQLARIDPGLASTYQAPIMACLEDPDDTIRRRTLALLLAICTTENVQPIVTQFLRFLRRSTDVFLRQKTALSICHVAERYARSPQWYIQTMNKLMAVAGACVPPSVAQRMLKLIAEGQGQETTDAAFRADCVEEYFMLMGAPGRGARARHHPEHGASRGKAGGFHSQARGFSAEDATAAAHSERLMRIAAWVMGEYGFLSKRVSRAMLLDRLCDMMDRTEETETRCWVVTAMMKLVAHEPETCPENVQEIVSRFQDSRSTNLQQRCNEFLALLKLPAPLMRKVLPLDGCCEDICVDEAMHMLDSLVQEARSKGARPYDGKAAQRYRAFHEDSTARTGAALRTEAYAPANKWAALGTAGSELGAGPGTTATLVAAAAGDDTTAWEDQLHVRSAGTTRRWGVHNLTADAPASTSAEPSLATTAHDNGSDLTLPTAALNRWTAHGGPQTQTADAGGVGSWELQDAEEPGAVYPSAPVSSAMGSHSAKTEKFVSTIFGHGRTKRRKGASTATAAAARHTPLPQSSRALSHATASGSDETLTRRRAATLDDLFGDGPSPASALPAVADTSSMDALFAPSAAVSASPRDTSLPSSTHSTLALTTRQGASQRTLYVLQLEVGGTGRVPHVAVELIVPPGCVLGDVHCQGHSQVRLATPDLTTSSLSSLTSPRTEQASCTLVITDAPTRTRLEVEMALSVANTTAFLRALADLAAQPQTSLTTTATASSLPGTGTKTAMLPFLVAHVLRPASENFHTPHFGEEWVNATGESQGELRPSSAMTIATLQSLIASRASLRVVEVIGSEVIAAAELITRARSTKGEVLYALCHCQLSADGTGATVLVHSRDAGLSDAVCRAVCRAN